MKVAILGAGGMGSTVIGHLKDAALVEQTIAYDVRPERIEELQRQGVKATLNLHDILNDPAVRLVFVTSPNATHKELTLQALAAGKAVMTEKPMATTLADARVMVEAAEAWNGFLQVGFELRYSKLYTQVKDWIDAGLLGDVINTHCFYVGSAWPKDAWRNQKEFCGDMFGEKLCHYVDLPRWWIGSQVKEVTSYCAPNTIPYYEVRDNYHTTYRFANDAVSHLTFMMSPAATFEGDPLQNVINQQIGDGHALRYLVVGTKGAAETDVFTRTIKRWQFSDTPKCFHSRWVETLTWDKEEDHLYYHNTHDQALDIVRRVHEGLPPMTPAQDAFETMRLSFAAEISASLRRTIRMDENLEELSD